jgi:aminopeptidase N
LELVYEQFNNAQLMTDRLAALTVLVNSHHEALKDQALAEFYHQFQDQPLVVDKWFLVQATRKSRDTFLRVQKLMQHPAFSLKNPNKIYNLPLAFTQNMALFHNESGAPYEFIVELIKTLDPINSIVSARLARSLMNYQRYSEPYYSLMLQNLENLAQGKLSKDVSEIVLKSLHRLS